MPAAVTPSGVRDGDPAALAGLCAARGPSVLAYCRHVAGDADAAAAAADAFAAFRAAVIATADLTGLNPEALLISAVRRAAARRAPHDQLGVCAVVPLLLAARAEKTLSVADREVLEQHLESCSGCRASVARFHAAERAYSDPPDSSIDLVTAATIVAAMVSAAPASAPEPPVATMNGSGHRPAAATGGDSTDSDAGSDSAAAAGLVDQPTAALHAAGVVEPDRAAARGAEGNGAAEPSRLAARTAFASSLLGSLGRSRGGSPRPQRSDEAEPEHHAVDEPGHARERPAARRAIGARIPRVRRAVPAPHAQPSSAATRQTTRRHAPSRSGLRLPLVLPVAVVLLALLAALFVAGVIGGSEPASSPRIAVPADPPGAGPPAGAGAVVVPGGEEAGADAVELAKERERARAKRRRAAPDAARPGSATPAAKPPPVTAPPAAATRPPAPAPAPAATPDSRPDDGSGRGRELDAGNGATGAEQIPPAEDTSTVPDLAPPPEPATAP